MNTQQKIMILKSVVSDLRCRREADPQLLEPGNNINPQDIDVESLPEINVVSDLITHHAKIIDVVDTTYTCSIKKVLHELSCLQNRKQNVSALLDSMTAIKEVKRLSYGFGETASQICKNLALYLQIKDKLFYCQKHVNKAQQHIKDISRVYSERLDRELKKSDSDSLPEVAKALNLIAQIQQDGTTQTTNERLSAFYLNLISKQFKHYEDELFKIPIVGYVTTSTYIFFDIAKEVMKHIVTVVNSYKGNIVKIGGRGCLHQVVVSLFTFSMEGIILELLGREKKYFQIDATPLKKISKDSELKIKEYFNEFCAIQNQIERLRMYLCSVAELSQGSYPEHPKYINELTNCTNTVSLIQINTGAVKCFQAYTRFSFDRLLKKSTFVVGLWQFDSDFIQKIQNNYRQALSARHSQTDRVWYESTDGQDYLADSYSIFMRALQKSLESLNIIIVSSMLSFINNNLVQEDSFHAFKSLYERNLQKFPSSEQKYYTALILVLNYTYLMPNGLQGQVDTVHLPQELQPHSQRIQNEMKEVVAGCEHKTRETITEFIYNLVDNVWFSNELQQDYRKVLSMWKGMIPEVDSMFVEKVSKAHAGLIFEQQFPENGRKPINLSMQSLIGLEKQLRATISHYEGLGHSVLNNFDRLLKTVEILMAETEQESDKLMVALDIEQEDKARICRLRKLKR